MKFAENARVFQLVGHGHRVHEAGNGLAVERDFTRGRIS